MIEFTRLKNNLKKSTNGLTTVRLAVLCDYASQQLTIALKGYGMDKKTAFEIYQAGYDQIEQQVFDEASALYKSSSDFLLLSKSSYKLLDAFYAIPLMERQGFAVRTFDHLQRLIYSVQQRSKATIILTNFLELNDAVFGNYANSVPVSFLYQVRKLNLLLMEEAQQQKGLLICDVQALTNNLGVSNAIDQKNLIKADLVWGLSFLPMLAKSIVGLTEAARGVFKKCVVLDLDNTLWGGVIGDDGLEGIELGDIGMGKAFSRLQKWIKELKHRGIIVCVCSKNNETVAKEVFEKHPDSILKLEDVAVFAANWNNKVDNLHYIKNTLNIGFDSMVFVDDNSFERQMVKEAIPELTVPELPEDAVEYLPYLQELNLFETVSYTSEDRQRTRLYQQAAERVAHQQVYKNENEYLASLQMTAEIKALDTFTVPRAAQLSQRSNQFNLRTVRYTEADLKRLSQSREYLPFVVSLRDKFGDYAIISFVVLKKEGETLFIESWMMSCRVLKRGVEQAVLNHIVELAKEACCQTIRGEYIATPKNGVVKDHYQNLGFKEDKSLWLLSVANYERRKTAVQPSTIISESQAFIE